VRVAAEVVRDGHHDVVIDGHGEEDGANEEDGEGASRDAEARADAAVHGCGLRHHPEHDGRGPDREHLHHRLPTPIAAGPPPPLEHITVGPAPPVRTVMLVLVDAVGPTVLECVGASWSYHAWPSSSPYGVASNSAARQDPPPSSSLDNLLAIVAFP
jgi:hypothetical protein